MRIDGNTVNCVTFVNRSDRTISAVVFAFSHVDEFGETQGKIVVTRTGTFSPGVPIEGPTPNVTTERTTKNCWREAIESYSLGTVTVAVSNVLFADGTHWESGSDPVQPAAETTIDYRALGLPDDMQRIALSRGRPCHVSSVDNAGGSVEVWHYNCPAGDTGKGKERYYFLNGRLLQHVVD